MALSAYRHILRSTSTAFQGDVRILHAARAQARNSFETHRFLSPTSSEAETQIAHAEEVARLLRENIVQGQKAGNEEDKFQLRIHENIERGNNESIKRVQSSSGPGTITSGCCSAA